jgi:hypothetical protein
MRLGVSVFHSRKNILSIQSSVFCQSIILNISFSRHKCSGFLLMMNVLVLLRQLLIVNSMINVKKTIHIVKNTLLLQYVFKNYSDEKKLFVSELLQENWVDNNNSISTRPYP